MELKYLLAVLGAFFFILALIVAIVKEDNTYLFALILGWIFIIAYFILDKLDEIQQSILSLQ